MLGTGVAASFTTRLNGVVNAPQVYVKLMVPFKFTAVKLSVATTGTVLELPAIVSGPLS
jgi:hypothetical protein